MKVVGFIGCGRIGGAMLKRLASKGGDFQLLAHDHSQSKLDHINRYVERLQEKGNESSSAQQITFVESIPELVERSDYIVIAIQQNELFPFLDELNECLTEDKVIISTMASVPMKTIRAKTRYVTPIVRVILNVPVTYGKGVIRVCYPKETLGLEIKNRKTYFLKDAQEDFIGKLLQPLGQKHFLDEDKVSIFTAVIASGPAYAFYFMEAMVQAAITMGMTYLDAKKCVAACVEGTAYIGGRDVQNFADLRMHASPPKGICTRAINQMEVRAVRGEIIDAILMAHDENVLREKEHDEK